MIGHFWANLKNLTHRYVKTDVATFWATYRNMWATF